MYVTRPLSLFKKSPSSLSLPPPDGPNSGILIIQDEEAETTCFFGLCKDSRLEDLPFPQNKDLKLRYTTSAGETTYVEDFYAAFIPVLNQPLSSNRYYVIKSRGKHQGEAYTNSKDEDMATCCFCRCVRDVPPQPFNPNNTHQQFEISSVTCCGGPNGFVAKSVSPDGFPPKFLTRQGWHVYTSTPNHFHLEDEAPGLNSALRSRLPDLGIVQPVVIGKWYCPFIFIREGMYKDQMKKSLYYQMTLEQSWEQIYGIRNDGEKGNVVAVDASVQTEVVLIGGKEAVNEKAVDGNGIVWFKSFGNKQEISVGLSLAIVERMKWEEERVGWVGEKGREVRVSREEEFGGYGDGEWRSFGCYVLVERFVLRRKDGSLVLTYDFKHSHQIRTKWE